MSSSHKGRRRQRKCQCYRRSISLATSDRPISSILTMAENSAAHRFRLCFKGGVGPPILWMATQSTCWDCWSVVTSRFKRKLRPWKRIPILISRQHHPHGPRGYPESCTHLKVQRTYQGFTVLCFFGTDVPVALFPDASNNIVDDEDLPMSSPPCDNVWDIDMVDDCYIHASKVYNCFIYALSLWHTINNIIFEMLTRGVRPFAPVYYGGKRQSSTVRRLYIMEFWSRRGYPYMFYQNTYVFAFEFWVALDIEPAYSCRWTSLCSWCIQWCFCVHVLVYVLACAHASITNRRRKPHQSCWCWWSSVWHRPWWAKYLLQ